MEVITVTAKKENEKARIAVYCRVSTKGDDQEDSLELQQDYYKNLIETRSDWALVGVYADERSGLNAEKRPQFMQMINDALDGKIDRILCKSVSRFSRNAAECRKYTDMLKMKNVFVEFEKENIRTDDPTSSLIFSLASAVADSESRSISDNVKWGFQQRYKRGEYKLGNNRILGYDTVDGKLVPNKDAWAIKKIYNDYLEGKQLKQIANELGEMGVISRTGRPYLPQTIDYILRNETYRGDKELWKTPVIDLYTKRPDPTQKRESIYLKNDHEAIIDDITWLKVKERLREKDEIIKTTGYLGKSPNFMYGQLFCGECGAPLRRGGHSSPTGMVRVWYCRNKYKGAEIRCTLKNIKEEVLKSLIVSEMGWKSFDENRFRSEISRVVIHGKDKITIVRK